MPSKRRNFGFWILDFGSHKSKVQSPNQICSDTHNSSRSTDEGGSLVAPLLPDAQDVGDAVAFAEAIKRAGMAGPASIALRVGGPLAWIGGQMLWAVQPLLEGLRVGAGPGRNSQVGVVSRLASFLEGEGNVAELVAHLETPPAPTAKTERKIGHGPSGGEADGPL